MSWLDKVLHRNDPPAKAAVPPAEKQELEQWKTAHKKILGKADDAIKRAMAHADEVMLGEYTGPERRHPEK